MSLVIVSRKFPRCPSCETAKIVLKSRGVQFEELEVTEEETFVKFKQLGLTTIPAFFSSKELSLESYLGGLDYLKQVKPE